MFHLYGAKAPWPFLQGLIRDNRPVSFFEETGLPYERISLDPMKGENRSDEYTKLNRFQKVPTLEHDGFVLTQSAAILHYLASSTGKLYPTEAKEQAKHLEWMFFAMTDVEPHSVQIAALIPMTDEADLEHAKWMVKRAEKIISRALNYLEVELAGKQFLMGDTFYAADILLGCCLYPIRAHQLVAERPNIRTLLGRYVDRPAFQRMLKINGT
ncbi:MAG: glutathione S-transferase family protein [Deltaproteobacteria bacterium]|nr:glutathione S-transferase family protein [Deltaproteobacteria bacterium]